MWAEFERVPKPWLVVIEDLDYPNPVGSFWGEVNASVYKALGAVGTITNGGVRDLPEVRATGFQFFSSSVLVSHAYDHIVEYGGPVVVGAVSVRTSFVVVPACAVVRAVVVGLATVFWLEPPSRPDLISSTAIVTATRKAAGAP